jgi:hypothetical protein
MAHASYILKLSHLPVQSDCSRDGGGESRYVVNVTVTYDSDRSEYKR